MPLLVTAMICRPLDRPYSAWYPCVRILTSAIDSTFMLNMTVLLPVSSVETPSMVMLVDMLAVVPSACAAVPLMTTPGASAARLVKPRF